MEIEILTSLVTMQRAFEKGDRTYWPDKADADRLIKAGYARPVPQGNPQRNK